MYRFYIPLSSVVVDGLFAVVRLVLVLFCAIHGTNNIKTTLDTIKNNAADIVLHKV